MKKCSKCKKNKQKKSFSPKTFKPSGNIGLNSWCKDCVNKDSRGRYIPAVRKIPKTTEERFEKYYLTIKGRSTHMLNNAKGRAKRNNIVFELTPAWLIPKLEKGICEVTKLPLHVLINGGKGHVNNSFSPSLDRVDRSKGYTRENTQLVCWIYNRAKGAFPLEDLMVMVKALNTPH